MDVRTGFFDNLFDVVARRVKDAAPASGLEITRQGVRGLYFSVKRQQPAREVTANFLGAGAYIHVGKAAIPADVVDARVAVRLTDSATLTVDQWADSMMEYLLKSEPAAAASRKPKASSKPEPRKAKK
jgi:hypothetical protein